MVKSGSIGLGALVGFVIMVALGWVPFFGAFFAGLVAGLIAKGAGRGLIAGLGAGLIGLFLITFVFLVAGALIGGIVGALSFGLIGMGISTFLGILWSSSILLAAVAGLIGGAISRRWRACSKHHCKTLVR